MAGMSLGGARKKGNKHRLPRTEEQLQVLRERLVKARAIKASKPKAARKEKAPKQAKLSKPSKKILEIANAVQQLPPPVAVSIIDKELKKKDKAIKKHRDEALLLSNLRERVAALANKKTGLNYKTNMKKRNELSRGLASLGYGDMSMGGMSMGGEYCPDSESDEDMMAGGAMMKHRKPKNTRGGFDFGSFLEAALPVALALL